MLALLLLVACGPGSSEPPTPTPTKTPDTAAQAEATPTPPAAATESPTAETTDDAADDAAGDVTGSAAESDVDGAAAEGERFITINADALNVRSAASPSGDILTTVASGEEFAVVDEQDGWVQIARGGETLGWVSADFVAESDGSGAAQVATDTETDATGEDTADATSEVTETETADNAAEPVAAAPAEQDCTFLPASMNSPDYGAQAFLWWRPEIANRDLTLMQDGAFNWVKQSFAWETIEIAPDEYNWSNADRVVRQVNCHQIKLLARLSTDPEVEASFWAGAPPANAANFASYAGAVAERYNCSAGAVGCIQAFQIWNEPNLSREWGGNAPDPAGYVEFLRQAYAAIKAVHPTAIVISAGMAPTGGGDVAMADEQFYEGMYAAMGGSSAGYFDMLGVHGPGFAAEPETDPATAASTPELGGYRFFAFRHVEDIRAIMERNGDGDKRIVLLEFGWTFDPVNPDYVWHGAGAGIDANVQGDYLRRAYQYADANWPWVGLMSMLTMPNFDWTLDGNPQDEEQYWWAIMEPTDVDAQQFRPAYIILCDYFNIARGVYCPYDPDPTKRGARG